MKDGTEGAVAAWERRALDRLIDELLVLRESMVEFESRLVPQLDELDAAGVSSARNLAHYLAMRSLDLRKVQEQLADIGVSSLGRAEPQVLANLDKVLGILYLLAGRACAAPIEALCPPPDLGALKGRAETLFGAASGKHRTRIMVTLPSAAAVDDGLVEALVRGGMNVARINCAHDGAAEWVAMAARVRRVAAANGRSVKVLMDLAGPKLRTGPIAADAAVLKLKPDRNALGIVTSPVRLGLRPAGRQRTGAWRERPCWRRWAVACSTRDCGSH